MRRLILCLVVIVGAGCVKSQESPPALPPLDRPLPGPPRMMELPESMSESLAIVDESGSPVTLAVQGSTATVQYRCQLPDGWGSDLNQAMGSNRDNYIILEAGILVKGKFAIGSQTTVKLKHTGQNLAIASAPIKLPTFKNKALMNDWRLRARVIQGVGRPALLLHEVPLALTSSSEPAE